jgi:hypothetical protein
MIATTYLVTSVGQVEASHGHASIKKLDNITNLRVLWPGNMERVKQSNNGDKII